MILNWYPPWINFVNQDPIERHPGLWYRRFCPQPSRSKYPNEKLLHVMLIWIYSRWTTYPSPAIGFLPLRFNMQIKIHSGRISRFFEFQLGTVIAAYHSSPNPGWEMWWCHPGPYRWQSISMHIFSTPWVYIPSAWSQICIPTMGYPAWEVYPRDFCL